MNRANIIFGILAIGIAGIVFYQLALFPEASPGDVGADFFPRILAVGLAISGVLLIGTSIMGKTKESFEAINFKDRSTQRAIVSLIATLLYCFSLEYLGFITGTIIFLMFMMFLLKERGFLKMTAISATVTGGVFIIFSELLLIDLPMGTLYGL